MEGAKPGVRLGAVGLAGAELAVAEARAVAGGLARVAAAAAALLAALLAVGTCHKWPGIPFGSPH